MQPALAFFVSLSTPSHEFSLYLPLFHSLQATPDLQIISLLQRRMGLQSNPIIPYAKENA
jgi:hypothetical protein